MSDFQEVISRVQTAEFIAKELNRPLKKVGAWVDLGECPFCGGHDCFRVRIEKQSWFCFQCDNGGDVITFVRLHRKLNHNYEALRIVAKSIGYPLKNGKDNNAYSQQQAVKEKIFQSAATYYHQLLMTDTKALNWIKKKRFHTEDVLKKWLVGWTGNDAVGLLNHLRGLNFTDKELLASGLVIKTDKKSELKDFFSPHFYVFPWIMNSFIGHFTVKNPLKKNPDYQLPNVHKNKHVLFGNQNAFFRDKIILIEGEHDFLTMYRACQADNLKNYGIAYIRGQISKEQLDFLHERCREKELYICFDHDEPDKFGNRAGERHTHKVIDAVCDVGDVFVLPFDENVKDIDDLLRAEDEPHVILQTMIKEAIDGIEWKIQKNENCDHPLKSRKVIVPILATISKIKDDRLDTYIDFILDKYSTVKKANIIKQLKQMGADVGTKEIAHFEVYDSTAHIYVSENCYWVPTKDDKRMISNFTFQLINIYAYEDAQSGERYLKYECIMTNYKGIKSESIVFEPEERVNVNKFMAKAASLGEFHFWGNTQNLLNVWSYVEHNAQDIRVTHLIQKYGYLENHDLWLFENCVIKKNKIYTLKNDIIDVGGVGFKSENVLIYGGDKPRMCLDLINDEFISQVVRYFWQVCDGKPGEIYEQWSNFKGLLLLGFIPAMIYRKEIMARYGCFPLLTCYGPSQTGKSVVTQILFSFFGFSNPAEAWEGMTPPGMTQFLSQVNSLPVWVDEFRNNSNRFHKTLMGTLRNAYNGVAPGKGGLQKRKIYDIGGIIWLSGEDTPNDRATLSRCAVARFTEINDSRTEAYNWFQQHKDKLSAITIKFIKEKTKENARQFIDNINFIMEVLLDRGINDERTRINIAIPVAGFYMFNYKKEDDDFQNNFFEYIAIQAEEDRQRKAGEDILTKFFEDMAYLMDKNPFSNYVIMKYDESLVEDILCVNFHNYYVEYKKELKTRGENIDSFKKETIKDYIIKSPYFYKPSDKRNDKTVIFDIRRPSLILIIDKMPKYIKQFFKEEKTNSDISPETTF